jgi:alpha-beta hydrolase superfamily lysophospholipase
MQNKELARKIIKRLNDVRQHKGIKNFSLLKLFSAALKEQGIQMKNLIPEKQTGEEVTFQSGELNLKGDVFRNGHSRKWIVGLHGYSSTKESMANLIWPMYNLGFNLFLFDARNHGASDDALITFGINETDDVLAALHFLKKTYKPKSVGLYGASMGAFTADRVALTAGAKWLKRHKVKFVISDSTYDNVYELMKNLIITNFPVAKGIATHLIDDIFTVYDEKGIDLKTGNLKIDAIMCDKTIPSLFLHGRNDKVTSYQCSENLVGWRQDIKGAHDEIEIFPDGPHVRSFMVNEEAYIKKIKDFLQKVGV